MAKDMSHGEIREYQGKKYKYQEIEAMESDINRFDTKCEGCDLKKECAKNYRIGIILALILRLTVASTLICTQKF